LAVILADTDVLIDYLGGIQPAARQVRGYAESGRLRTSAVNCFELLSGADQSKRGDDVRRLIASTPVLPLDLESAAYAARIRRELSMRGVSIGMGDGLIAGIALANGLQLFTRNRRHFEQVEGLRLVPVDQ
jgi:tRNA(fMet)-specific endonuclease VapC